MNIQRKERRKKKEMSKEKEEKTRHHVSSMDVHENKINTRLQQSDTSEAQTDSPTQVQGWVRTPVAGGGAAAAAAVGYK